jgi:hypothetical protein
MIIWTQSRILLANTGALAGKENSSVKERSFNVDDSILISHQKVLVNTEFEVLFSGYVKSGDCINEPTAHLLPPSTTNATQLYNSSRLSLRLHLL